MTRNKYEQALINGEVWWIPTEAKEINKPDYAEALRLIRKHMQPGDTIGRMFMRVAKDLEAEHFTQSGAVCDGCGKVLICRNCGLFRSGVRALDGERK